MLAARLVVVTGVCTLQGGSRCFEYVSDSADCPSTGICIPGGGSCPYCPSTSGGYCDIIVNSMTNGQWGRWDDSTCDDAYSTSGSNCPGSSEVMFKEVNCPAGWYVGAANEDCDDVLREDDDVLAESIAFNLMVKCLDDHLGLLLNQLAGAGKLANTTVIFLGDNGTDGKFVLSPFADSTQPSRKMNVYEGGIRVPLIVTWPGRIEAGSSDATPVANWDLMPTLLSVAGARTEAEMDGIDFSPVLLGSGPAPGRDHLYWEFHAGGGLQAVRMGKWKGVRNGVHRDPETPVELYDLETDPFETTDVSAEHPEVAARVLAIMRDEHTVSPVPNWNFGWNEGAPGRVKAAVEVLEQKVEARVVLQRAMEAHDAGVGQGGEVLLLAVDVVEAVAAQGGLLDHLEHEALARRAVRAENCGAGEAAASWPAANEVVEFQRHEILLRRRPSLHACTSSA